MSLSKTPSLPSHLAGTAAAGLIARQPIAQFELGSMQNFVYLIIDWANLQAAIVDPQKDIETPLQALHAHRIELTSILLTHTHHDHVAGLWALAERYPSIPIHAGQADLHRIEKKLRGHPGSRAIADGDRVAIGSLTAEVLHTPGHSSGECCFRIDADRPYLLTGDTLFIRDCGRTDLETGSNADLFHSLQRIKSLAPETIILPGHHYAAECASSLEKELLESPPLKCRSVEELASLP